MKDDAPDAAGIEGIQERAQQGVRDATPSPIRFDVDVEHDRFWPEFEIVGVWARPRQQWAQLRTSTTDDGCGAPSSSAIQARYSPRGRALPRYAMVSCSNAARWCEASFPMS